MATPAFDSVILGVILFNALILGSETYGDLRDNLEIQFDFLNNLILGIYVVELLIRLTACQWRPSSFVQDKWNIFDFLVVTASFAPGLHQYAMALRLVRVLRIVRIVRFLPELRVVLHAIGRSIPGVASLAAATILLIYIYGMVGWALFNTQDPQHFGDVGQAMLTMFVMLTFANLEDTMSMGLHVSNWTILFFISYVVIVGFLLFNLFVGIVLNAMGEARSADRATRNADDLSARLQAARGALDEAERELRKRVAPTDRLPEKPSSNNT
ncbi:voltage-gated sodium channel [Mycobacterium sp. OAE908]|uniref:ion transporter n=1 Tax=Mycobacterium sp. OAE908 TaxID=2817899 RepID=UPI0034E29366